MIWGVSADGGKAFGLGLANDSLSVSKTLAAGSWTFYAVGWAGPAGYNLEGNVRCAKVSAQLQGSEAEVSLGLSAPACNDPFFASSSFLTGQTIGAVTSQVPQPLRLITCADLSGVTSGGANCNGGTRGDLRSFQVLLPDFEAAGAPSISSQALESHCLQLDPNSPTGNSVLDTGVKVPVGQAGAAPFVVVVRGYTDASCATSAGDFVFAKGLQNAATSGTAKLYAYSGFSELSLQHGTLLPAPSGLSLVAPAASPGNVASPVLQVSGVQSGDTVSLYSDGACASASIGSAVAAGPTVNVTASARTNGSSTTFYAKRQSGTGVSACSTASVTYLADFTAPTVTVSTGTASPSNTTSFVASFTFSEAVTGFSVGSLTVTNGSASGFSGSGSSYSATITPTPNTTATVTVGASAGVDAAGNASAASNTLSMVNDVAAPTVALTATEPDPSNATSFPVTITFSEAVTGLTAADFSVTNGTIGAPSTANNITYTATVTPTANALVTVSLPASSVTDAAGNANTASGSLTRQNDVTAPNVANVTSPAANGSFYVGDSINITVTFSENVVVTGMPTLALNNGGTASYASGSGTATLTFQYTVASGQTNADLDYASTSALSLSGGTIKDAAGNNAALTLPTPGASGSLGYNKNLDVHGTILLSVAAVYPSNADWGSYVQFANGSYKDYNQSSETACSGSETGYYGELNGCIHGGEKRKVVVTGISTCANLTITDALSAWDWVCDASSGTATFYTRGLQKGKGLRDLIGASSFNNNSVQVRQSGTDIADSPSAVWGWGNTILSLPMTTSGVQTLSTAGGIYRAASSGNTRGFSVAADRVSIVTPSGVVLSYDGGAQFNFASSGCGGGSGATHVVCAASVKFLWLEASIDGGSGFYKGRTGLNLYSVKHSRVNIATMKGLTEPANAQAAVELNGSSSNLLTGVVAQGVGTPGGLRLVSSTYNRFRGLKFGDNEVGGSPASLISVTSSSGNNRFDEVSLSNIVENTGTDVAAIYLNSGSGNSFANVTISNLTLGSGNTATGVRIQSGAANAIVSNLTVNNTADSGVFLDGATNSIVNHVTVANAGWQGVLLNGANTVGNYVHSALVLNSQYGVGTDTGYTSNTGNINHIRDLAISDVTAGEVLNFAQPSGGASVSGTIDLAGYLVRPSSEQCTPGAALVNTLSSSCSYTGLSVVSAGSSLATAVQGKVTGTDAVNGSGVSSGTKTYSLITDWMSFESPFRSWGLDGSAFPNSNHWGPCLSGNTCRVWDWRAKSGSAVNNRSYDGQNANGTFTAGSACPAAVDGNLTATAGGRTFLLHAVEIDEDDLGNNNGLCESGEACIYAPNIGAYQGEGNPFAAGSCIFSNGTVTGVTMYAYPTTGI